MKWAPHLAEEARLPVSIDHLDLARLGIGLTPLYDLAKAWWSAISHRRCKNCKLEKSHVNGGGREIMAPHHGLAIDYGFTRHAPLGDSNGVGRGRLERAPRGCRKSGLHFVAPHFVAHVSVGDVDFPGGRI